MVRFLIAMLAVVFFNNMSNAYHVTGNTAGLNKHLVANLNRMARHFRTDFVVTPHGGCRKHGSRAAPRSYHRVSAGCKAADIIPKRKGVSKKAILNWWKRNVGGGRGYYCGRPFVHVDVGPDRHWAWFCRHKK